MSLIALVLAASHTGFPRVSGDEPPSSADAIYAARFSPRERG